MRWLALLAPIFFATAALAQSPFGGQLNPLNPLGIGCLTGTFCVWTPPRNPPPLPSPAPKAAEPEAPKPDNNEQAK
jgi:hypothetical protein